MSDGRLPPHDLDAEITTLGAMLLSVEAGAVVFGMLTATDFYKPQHQSIFAAMWGLRKQGIALDVITVSDQLKSDGVEPGDLAWVHQLLEMQNATPTISNVEHYAQIVVDHSVRRGIISMAADLAQSAYQLADPTELFDKGRARLSEVAIRAAQDSVFEDLVTWQQFVADYRDKPRMWVIPHILAEMERLLLVAPEGAGKGTLMRQIAICAAGGLHPFTGVMCDPVPTLYLDLENPGPTMAYQAQMTLDGGARMLTEHIDAWLLHREAGVNLRSAKDQLELEKAMQFVKPKILLIGPIYKAAQKRANEQWEEATLDVLRFLDDLRTRYRCALIMEHHAPKGSAGSRDLAPFGSGAWLRWPDYGIKLEPTRTDRSGVPEELRVGTFRGSRMSVDWPDTLVRGNRGNLPWMAGPTRPR